MSIEKDIERKFTVAVGSGVLYSVISCSDQSQRSVFGSIKNRSLSMSTYIERFFKQVSASQRRIGGPGMAENIWVSRFPNRDYKTADRNLQHPKETVAQNSDECRMMNNECRIEEEDGGIKNQDRISISGGITMDMESSFLWSATSSPWSEGLFPKYEGLVPLYEGSFPWYEGLFPKYESLVPPYEEALPWYEGLFPKYESLVPLFEGALPWYEGLVPRYEEQFPKLVAERRFSVSVCGAEKNRSLCNNDLTVYHFNRYLFGLLTLIAPGGQWFLSTRRAGEEGESVLKHYKLTVSQNKSLLTKQFDNSIGQRTDDTYKNLYLD